MAFCCCSFYCVLFFLKKLFDGNPGEGRVRGIHMFLNVTPWRNILLEILTVPQLGMIFSTCYGSLKFITVFTRVGHLFLSWVRSVQSTPFQPISSRSFSILSSHWSLNIPNGFFPWMFPTKTLYAPLLSSICIICPARFVLLLMTRKLFSEDYGLWSSSLCSLIQSAVASSMYIWNCYYLSSRKDAVFLHLHT